MANEAKLIHEYARPLPFTVADGVGINKGSILKMTDPMTAIINSARDDIVAGIAANEKIASDGKTKIPVFREGIFKVSLSGSCTIGDALSTDKSPNYVKQAVVSAISGSTIIGYAMEAGTDDQTILMELRPTFVSSHL